MPGNIIGLMALVCAAITLFMCLIGIFAYGQVLKKAKLTKYIDSEEWLFSNFHETVYDLMYKKQPYDTMVGINIDQYRKYCEILGREYEPKKMVALRIEGVAILMAFAGLSYSMLEQSSVISVMLLCIGVVACYLIGFNPYRKLKNEADERIFRIKDDLPRYLSLLEKALDFSIDQALRITSTKFDSPLSSDILQSLNRVSLGAGGWQDSLIKLANVYNIDAFNDVVMDLINAHEQGMNIRVLVNRKCYEIEQIRLFDVEQHDQKIKSMIYFPIMAMKLLPMLAIICYPMLRSSSL